MRGRYKVYILKSARIGCYDVGSTSDLARRLQHHNGPEAGWTKRYQPWQIIYVEEFETRAEAVRREKFLKSKEGIADKMRILQKVDCNPYG